jgi:hypothetical protein
MTILPMRRNKCVLLHMLMINFISMIEFSLSYDVVLIWTILLQIYVFSGKYLTLVIQSKSMVC